jgi:hypothetical protein
MTFREKLKQLNISMVREVIDHMSRNSLAEIEFRTSFRINVDELFGEDYHLVPVMVIGLNALGELYLDDGGCIPVNQISIHELAYVLDKLEEKDYVINEYETVPDK